MGRKKIEGVCSVENCKNPIKSLGYCNNHYQMNYLYGRTTKIATGERSNHPLYHLWHERKQAKVLCEEWANDFWLFVKDVGEKPSKSYLVKLQEGLLGPTNFKWFKHLTRNPGESQKDWWARKWATRQAANPLAERGRHYPRNFGITLEQYEDKVREQNNLCAVCGKPETSFDSRTGNLRRLAVDHNHSTNKIRDLLCWRCNGTIGRIEEDLDLLDKLRAYLLKHLN